MAPTWSPSASAQDHKRVGDGDTGPNTGGMGAYSPAPVLTPELQAEVMDRIIEPTVAYMAAQGMPYSGVLFAGLMLTDEGPKLIEYNARFGDPECQVLMTRFTGDLAALMLAVATGSLLKRMRRLLARYRADRGDGRERLSRHAAKGRRRFRSTRWPAPRSFTQAPPKRTASLSPAGGRVLNVTATGQL